MTSASKLTNASLKKQEYLLTKDDLADKKYIQFLIHEPEDLRPTTDH